MKKILCLTLCLLMLFSGTACLGETAATDGSIRSPLACFAVSGDSVWRANSATLTCETQEGAHAASAEAANIVAMTGENSTVWCLRGEPGAQTVEQYDANCERLSALSLPDDFYGWQIAANGATLYLLGICTSETETNDWSDVKDARIYRLAAEAGAVPEPVRAEGWDNQNIDSFCFSRGTLYIHGGLSYFTANAESGELATRPIEFSAYRRPLASGPDLDGAPYVYLIESDGAPVKLLNLKTGEAVALSDDLPTQDAAGLVADNGMLYAMSRADGLLHSALAARPDDTDYTGQLCIVNLFDYPSVAHAVELFHERYPDVQVAQRTEYDERVLSAALMSGAPGYDIVFTGGGASDFLSPLSWASGAMLDLAQYPEVTQHLPAYQINFDSWQVGDALYGVPLYFSPNFWQIDLEIAAAAGVERPGRDWTWADLAQMADQLEACNRANGTDYKLLTDSPILPFFMQQYTTNALDVEHMTIDYRSEDLRDLLALYRDWHDRGLLTAFADSAPSLFTAEYGMSFVDLYAPDVLIPPAIRAGDRPLSSAAPSIHVNSNTGDPEMAAYFVACVLNPESEQCNELVFNGPSLKDDSGYAVGEIAQYYGMPSEETLALWSELAEHSLTEVFINDLYREQADILFPKYLAGEMSAEEFQQTCQRRSDMILGE
ncbi:MAG: ABC transporter substrate-binding protein [Clostridia bacterium]|nr:ABC transporter substrate-binding protein [Clostridia bacterium]